MMKNKIRKILREETYWQDSDDKWNKLEKELRYVVERLSTRRNVPES